MTGINANVLLRYITRDSRALAARAAAVVEERCSTAAPGFVTILALAEVYWTLRSSYEYRNEEIETAIETLLKAKELRFEQEEAVWYALDQARAGFGFADALIGRIGAAHGCSTTMTFDKKAAKLPELSEA